MQRPRRVRLLPDLLGPGLGDTNRWGLPLGLIMLAILFAADVIPGSSTHLTGAFLMAPLLCALFGSPRGTALVAALAICLGAVSPLWNTDAGVAYVISLAAISASGAFAVAGAQARDRSRGNTGRLRLLDAIGEIADGSLPLADTLTRTTELIVPDAADMCMIDVIHKGRVVRAAVRVGGVPQAAEIEERLRSRTPSIPGRFVTPERPWIQIAHFRSRMDSEDLRRMAQDPEDLKFLESLRPRSSIISAVTARGRTLGTLTLITTWSKRRYTADDVRFAQVLAPRIGLALDNAGLFSDLESVERRLDTVMSMLDQGVTVHDASGDLVYANDAVAHWLGFASPREVLDAPEQELLRRFDVWTEDGTRLDRNLIMERFRKGRLSGREHVRIALKATGEERWAVVSSESINSPDGSLLYAVTTVEDVTELKRSEFAQQLLARTGELLASSTDYRETLQAVAGLVVPQFADWCTVNIPDRDGLLERVAIAHIDAERIAFVGRLRERYPVRMDDAGPLPEVIRSGQPRLIPGIPPERLGQEAMGEEELDLIRGVRTSSAIVAPMTAGAKVVGVLVFANEAGSRRFGEGDLQIALEIAGRAGLAAENARLAEEQAGVAHDLQRGLRPTRLPAMRGFEVATMYRPAGELNEVGGDFYEAFEIQNGWMLAIGDVMGRGAPAASVTALARYTIRTAGKLTSDPRSAALLLDEGLKQGADLTLCSAIMLAIPDSDDDPVPASLLVAGHPLPLLVRRGTVDPVGQSGPLLGAPHQPRWELTTLELSRGDQLVLYTDGVTEARGESERFGEDRLRAGLSLVADPTQAVSRIESALDSFLVDAPEDDAAMVVIMRSGTARTTVSSGPSTRAVASTRTR
jgi:PAS domain S-box-containing protein